MNLRRKGIGIYMDSRTLKLQCKGWYISQNVNLFQIYQRFEQLFGGDWCNIQSASYKYQKDTRRILVSF